ncbi:hypothetical protein [Herpetosiphon llansteffanensis]|uniref:hypothetical protein n=1 Tax=Herpetosiphon llansteffanensis TaxID=2094568 RepID=UPI000D7C0D85|nr:hypothetical protein [Herpetosiphon llansteffanensis]
MNPNNPQNSFNINGNTFNGGNVAIGNQGNINQTNNNYITHQNSNENIAVFGKLSIYLKSHKRYQDFDPYVPFSCIAKIIENGTGRSVKYTLFTGFLYLTNPKIITESEYSKSYSFSDNDENLLPRIFSNMINGLKNSGFYFKEEIEKDILRISINGSSLHELKSFTGSDHDYFLHIYEDFISIDKTKYTSMYSVSINADNISINQKFLNRSLSYKPRYGNNENEELIKIPESLPIIIFILTLLISCSQFDKIEISMFIIIGTIILLKVLGFFIDLINHIHKNSD